MDYCNLSVHPRVGVALLYVKRQQDGVRPAMHILLIEDDPVVVQAIRVILAKAKYSMLATTSGEEGIDLAKLYDYDLILLDLALPDMNGIEVLRHLRLARNDTPVLILTGSDNNDSKLKGFGLGADDYLTKPFDQGELLARMQAIIRRTKGHSHASIRLGELVVDLNTRSVEARGKPVHVTTKEYQILELLVIRKGATVAKETFLNHLYGNLDEPDSKIIDVFVCKLRKKLSDALGGTNIIETVWGRGYVLRDLDNTSSAKKAKER
jgi:two-component system, cell cycle response regulator CtrA